MIKFLQLLTIDRPVLSFLFANACSCCLVLFIYYIIDYIFMFVNYYFQACIIAEYMSLFMLFLSVFRISLRVLVLIIYSEIILKTKQDNWVYKFVLSLKNNNKFKIILLLFLLSIFSILGKSVKWDMNFAKMYFWSCSLFLSYLVLFIYWTIKDTCIKFLKIIKRKKLFVVISCFVNKLMQIINDVLNKFQIPIFILTNLLCSSYIFIRLIVKHFNWCYIYGEITILSGADDYLADLLFLNYLYQLIRYILIFKVFDIYSKLESGQVVDFIKKLKTSSKCRKVTSIVLFSIDTFFILLLSRGTSCNHCCIYWIMSYFFGLMSMYFVMFYYWHLENKHKDVLAEVE